MLHIPTEYYLSKNASPYWKIEPAVMNKFKTAVIIPAICEYNNIRRLLNSLSENEKDYFDSSLFIFVINNHPSSSVEVKYDNKKSIELILDIIRKDNLLSDELVKKIILSGINISLIDASTTGNELPEKEAGVGLARKIGMDLALTVLDYGTPGKKILICLDADCVVENKYLNEIVNSFNNKNLHAAVISYEHEICGTESEAIISYEIFLRYYELGLRFAGSPFAFHAIGSTIVCDYENYIKIGGMNKRKAGEDFYFLEKLAKVTSIERIKSTTVFPSSRGSWRVPFGTGQRINRFLSKTKDEYLLYDPETLLITKKWLEVFLPDENYETKLLINLAGSIDVKLKDFLLNHDFESDWDKILANSKSKQQIKKQKLNWFDGFKTMKLIHYLRDNGFPVINMFDALDKFIVMYDYNFQTEAESIRKERKNQPVPSLEIQRKYLNLLRTISGLL